MPQPPSPKRHPYDQWSPDARALDLVGDKWTLLIIRDLEAGPRRFVELQRILPGISTEQLRSRLNRMVADGLLTRKRYREVPPRVDYELTGRARDLTPVLGALARWGQRWAWSPPRSGEAVDVTALFRLAPGLVPPVSGRSGTVGLEVRCEGAASSAYRLELSEQGARIFVAEVTDSADARVTGSERAWIAALSPTADASGLTIAGDHELAEHVLRALGDEALTDAASLAVA